MQAGSDSWDLIVIGAGAAGLPAATAAAERGKRTLLLEKTARIGTKILISGGSRCNVTHATDPRGIVAAFGRSGRFLHSALAILSPQDLIRWLAAEGVPTKTEPDGKVFPVSDRAADVRDAFLKRLRRSGAQLGCEQPAQSLVFQGDHWQVSTRNRHYHTPAVIVACGGQSYPQCGTTGDGYAWLRQLGHTIRTPRPALTPLLTREPWVRELQGITLPDVAVRILPPTALAGSRREQRRAVLASARGSLLWTHFGLSGPVVLNVSRAVSGHPHPAELAVVCDLIPDWPEAACAAELDTYCRTRGRSEISGWLSSPLPRRVADRLVDHAGLSGVRAADCSRRQREQLLALVKQLVIPLAGVRGFRQAEVTAGGVCLSEVDSRTMQSRLLPGLYVVGELLDLDGPIGGYNLQAAFSTGWLAGRSV